MTPLKSMKMALTSICYPRSQPSSSNHSHCNNPNQQLPRTNWVILRQLCPARSPSLSPLPRKCTNTATITIITKVSAAASQTSRRTRCITPITPIASIVSIWTTSWWCSSTKMMHPTKIWLTMRSKRWVSILITAFWCWPSRLHRTKKIFTIWSRSSIRSKLIIWNRMQLKGMISAKSTRMLAKNKPSKTPNWADLPIKFNAKKVVNVSMIRRILRPMTTSKSQSLHRRSQTHLQRLIT